MIVAAVCFGILGPPHAMANMTSTGRQRHPFITIVPGSGDGENPSEGNRGATVDRFRSSPRRDRAPRLFPWVRAWRGRTRVGAAAERARGASGRGGGEVVA